jgi:hypothetical protein
VRVEEFRKEFPKADELLRLFRMSDAVIPYAAPVRRDAPSGSWELRLRLPPRLQDHFGISRQILVYCLRATDVQTRDINRLRRLIDDSREPWMGFCL